jgi:hypothetical protein
MVVMIRETESSIFAQSIPPKSPTTSTTITKEENQSPKKKTLFSLQPNILKQ